MNKYVLRAGAGQATSVQTKTRAMRPLCSKPLVARPQSPYGINQALKKGYHMK